MFIKRRPDLRQMKLYRLFGKGMMLLMLFSATALLSTGCSPSMVKRGFIGKNLEGINLSGMDFYNVNLEKINLSRSKLVKTNFSFSNLKNTKFINTDLRFADLSAADLTGADLRGANLRYANLHNTVLAKANLVETYFYDADLSGADLRGTVMVSGVPDGSDMKAVIEALNASGLVQYTHLRNADFSGTAVSIKLKNFIQQQGVRNFDKIIWVK
jgi:uncharacterized protein YjbI with pentapeptide repeats